MGLVKKVKSVSELRSIPVEDSFYNLIDKWKHLYSGYLPEFHDTTSKSIEGQKKRQRATLNMAKVVSQEMASLVFNEKCSISISDDTVSEYIDRVLDNNEFNRNFQSYLEYQFAMGGIVIKPYVSDGQVKLSYVTADCFIPLTYSNKGIYEAVFFNETTKGDKVYTLLEWHYWDDENYIIKNELYESSKLSSELGIKVPLSAMYPNVEEEVSISGLKHPLFVYFRPNTANHIDLTSPLGISIFAHALDTLKLIDIAYDSYQREFILGRKRILVPAESIRTVINPETGIPSRYFDASDEIYEAMHMDDSAYQFKDLTVELRVEEHISAIKSLLNILSMQIGFSPGSFSFDGQGVKTATEVVSENSKTFRTKQSHENIIEAGLTQLIESIIELSKLYGIDMFANNYNTSDLQISIVFDDSIADDQNAEIDRQIKLVTSGLTSKVRAIMKAQKVTKEEAEDILKEIAEENKKVAVEDIDFFALGGNEQ